LEVMRTLRAHRGQVDPKRLTHLRHEQAAFAAMHGADLLYLVRDP
jgi:hypothetical protein